MPERVAVTQEPYNAETPREALLDDVVPVGAFYVRNHFPIPALDAETWRLRVTGAVSTPDELTYSALLAMPNRTLDVVMECAGNGRTRMSPQPPGTPWGERAVACARFTGVPLRDVLERCGVRDEASEILFVGADRGDVHGKTITYERSLPVAKALHPDTLLVTHMNDAPLAPEHGAPLRLLVPGWYGVASVKWLTEIRALTRSFDGFYQTNHYVYRQSSGMPEGPVTTMRVKSLLAEPAPGHAVDKGHPTLVAGRAWSGDGAIRTVEISDDGGRTWTPAKLTARADAPYAWTGFTHWWTPQHEGTVTLLARATDTRGHVQPLDAPWNALGYGYNAAARVDVEVR